jgi:hypothetical protein
MKKLSFATALFIMLIAFFCISSTFAKFGSDPEPGEKIVTCWYCNCRYYPRLVEHDCRNPRAHGAKYWFNTQNQLVAVYDDCTFNGCTQFHDLSALKSKAQVNRINQVAASYSSTISNWPVKNSVDSTGRPLWGEDQIHRTDEVLNKNFRCKCGKIHTPSLAYMNAQSLIPGNPYYVSRQAELNRIKKATASYSSALNASRDGTIK